MDDLIDEESYMLDALHDTVVNEEPTGGNEAVAELPASYVEVQFKQIPCFVSDEEFDKMYGYQKKRKLSVFEYTALKNHCNTLQVKRVSFWKYHYHQLYTNTPTPPKQIVSRKEYHSLKLKNEQNRKQQLHSTVPVYYKDGELYEPPKEKKKVRMGLKRVVKHVNVKPSIALRESFNMECSQCETNQYMIHDEKRGLICGNCNYELQCLKCRTKCNDTAGMLMYPSETGGYYICMVCTDQPMIQNYKPRLRCNTCKSTPTPDNITSSEDGVWQCLICHEDTTKCKDCRGNLIKEITSDYEFIKCVKCGKVRDYYPLDELYYPTPMAGDQLLTKDGASVTTKYTNGSHNQMIQQDLDSSKKLTPQQCHQIYKLCNALLTKLQIYQGSHERIKKEVLAIVDNRINMHAYRVDVGAGAALFKILQKEEIPTSEKQFRAAWESMNISVRSEQTRIREYRKSYSDVMSGKITHEQHEDEMLKKLLPDPVDTKRAIQHHLTRALRKVSDDAVKGLKDIGPWQKAENLIQKWISDDAPLQQYFESRPTSHLGTFLEQAKWQIRYMHYNSVLKGDENLVSRLMNKKEPKIHEIAGICFYLIQQPLIKNKQQRLQGRNGKCKQELLSKLQILREHYIALMNLVTGDKSWVLPEDLGLPRNSQLVSKLKNYEYKDTGS